MAHKSGFTFPVLSMLFREAGFEEIFGAAIPQNYEIWIIAFKKLKSEKTKLEMAQRYLP